MRLQVITPATVAIEKEVDEVRIPTPQGQIGILPNHAPLITAVSPGTLLARTGNYTDYLATGSGIAHIVSNTVSVLTDEALRAEEIDERAEQEARRRAQVALQELRSDEEIAATLALIERATAKLVVKRRHRSRIPMP